MHFASGVALTNDLEVLATFPDARFNSYVQISYSSFPRSRRILGAARIKSSAPVGKPRIDLDQLREISSPNRHGWKRVSPTFVFRARLSDVSADLFPPTFPTDCRSSSRREFSFRFFLSNSRAKKFRYGQSCRVGSKLRVVLVRCDRYAPSSPIPDKPNAAYYRYDRLN